MNSNVKNQQISLCSSWWGGGGVSCCNSVLTKLYEIFVYPANFQISTSRPPNFHLPSWDELTCIFDCWSWRQDGMDMMVSMSSTIYMRGAMAIVTLSRRSRKEIRTCVALHFKKPLQYYIHWRAGGWTSLGTARRCSPGEQLRLREEGV